MQNNKLNSGFTLLEVLIAFFVLSFGLLGAIALQAKAKQASFDSMQRAAAVALGNDIMQRIRANGTETLVADYNQTFDSDTDLDAGNTCMNVMCDSNRMALADLEQWKLAIRARENSGTLDNTEVCINVTNANGPRAFNVRVIISWQGRQAMEATQETRNIQCGEENGNRRLVVLNSFIFTTT
jgi:type IV pilus assembly protein PilV